MSDTADILVVDDSEEDARLLELFAKRAQLTHPLVHVTSGQEALDYLASPENPLPGLVLLDIRMPGLDGHETLAQIRAHDQPRVAQLPVVMLTTSNEETDVRKAYRLHASGYIVKPMGAAGYRDILHSLDKYWFQVVRRPAYG